MSKQPADLTAAALFCAASLIALPVAAQDAGRDVQEVMTNQDQYPAEDEAEYMRRFNGLWSGELLSGKLYAPREAVPGAADFTPLPRAEPDEVRIADWALDLADEYAGNRNSQALIVWHDGKVVFENYYNGADADTLIISRSLAKPVSVAAVGRAIAEGYIDSLTQSTADFITEWQGTEKAEIQVRNLLDMRSGFLAQGLSRDPNHILNRSYTHPRHVEIIIKDYPLTHKPGTRYDYNNATSEMVAPLIQRATDRRYADWVGKEVLQKIGAQGGEVWINRPGGMAHSGCCIMLPAESFLRLALLTFQDGVWDGERLLPEGFVETIKTPTPQNPWAGMGLYVAGNYVKQRGAANPDLEFGTDTLHSEPYLAADLFLYDGNANQVVYMIPSEKLIILRVGNPPPKHFVWDNTFLPNILLRGLDRAPGDTPPPPQPVAAAP